MVTKQQIKKYLEEKYKREVLGGASYIDSRERVAFRKWSKKQDF